MNTLYPNFLAASENKDIPELFPVSLEPPLTKADFLDLELTTKFAISYIHSSLLIYGKVSG